MRRTSSLILILAALVLLALPVSAETLPVTIWQKERRFQPKQGQTIRLQRGSFTLVLPLKVREWIGLVAAPGPVPTPLESFDPGRGLAGPYDGLFLTWEAFHYFHVDTESGDPRMALWDRQKGLYHWRADRFYDLSGESPLEMDWSEVPDATLIFRKDGFEDLTVHLEWVD
jgi:hypothetical protein